MDRTLSDEDVEAVAVSLLKLVIAKLLAAEKAKELPPAMPPPPPSVEPMVELKPKLAYSLAELSQELGLSKATIYRLVYRRLLRPLPYLRTKTFARAEVERFLASGTEWSAGKKRSG